jgi:hypothetical protein
MNWRNVKHLFEWDGAWLDIYVFDTNAEAWQQLMDALRTSPYALTFRVDGETQPFPQHVSEVFAQREQANTLLNIQANGLTINCHFFRYEEIEIDINPREVQDEEAFSVVTDFMRFVGQRLRKRAVLTPENGADIPLITYYPDDDRWEYAPS